MSYDELEQLVNKGLTQRAIATQIGKSQTTVKYWLKKHGLRTKSTQSARVRKQYAVSFVGDLGSRAELECPVHGLGEYYLESGKRYRCKACNSEAILRRKRKYKKELVEQFGGECQCCGYNKSVEALEFHHTDPETKDFDLSKMTSKSRELVWAEAKKCILVCSNCHREIEAGIRVP